jgi:hypothetical protein
LQSFLIVFGFIFLGAVTAWSIWDQHNILAALRKEKARRVDIAKTADRLVTLWQGKTQFESAVSDADKAWAGVKDIPRTWASFQRLAEPQRGVAVASSLRPIGRWHEALRNIDGIVRRTVGDIGNPINGQTDHYDPTAKVDGEENFPAEDNIPGNPLIKTWREATHMHTHTSIYIASARGKLSSEITELEQKLTVAAREDIK